MWSVVLIPRLQITVSAWRLLLLMRMALCWTATRELTIYSFTYLTVLSVTLAQRTGGVNLAGILGGRRGGSRRLGTPPHREGSGYGLGPSPEKKEFSLEIACFWCILGTIFVRVLAKEMLNFPPEVLFRRLKTCSRKCFPLVNIFNRWP